MHKKYPKLFSKYKVNDNLTLRNRLVMAPMGFVKEIDGGISDRQMNYLVERARGGFGLIYPAAHVICDRWETVKTGGGNYLVEKQHAERLGMLADRVHQLGAKLAVQFSPGLGRVNPALPEALQHVSASDVPTFFYPDVKCHALTEEEIGMIIKDCGRSALWAKQVGVDIIEIHSYGGYLLDQFLSPMWNKRTDKYGGSLENRMRFTLELAEEIWRVCGKDYPVSVKYTPVHSLDGGRTFEDEGVEMAKIFASYPFAYIHLDHGAYENWHRSVTTCYESAGCQLFLAERLRQEGITKPFFIQGKLWDPAMAEKALEDGLGELIGIGHQSIADPFYPTKVKYDRQEDIAHCIGCNECIYRGYEYHFRSCAINPLAGKERDYNFTEPKIKRKLLVIGGGPGGMYTAYQAARLGHDVELWEKSDRLGGLLNSAGAPSFKYDTMAYRNHLEAQVNKAGVRVLFNKEATADDIEAYGADYVVLAAGAAPIVPRIPGVKGDNVLGATQVLADKAETGKKVIVLGGGDVGCETALHLAEQGKEVVIVEMLDALLKVGGRALNMTQGLWNLLNHSTVKACTSSQLTEILPDRVKVKNTDSGVESEILCDTVVLAVGFKSSHTLADELEERDIRFSVIGNNQKPGKVFDAVNQGHHVVRLLEDLLAQ